MYGLCIRACMLLTKTKNSKTSKITSTSFNSYNKKKFKKILSKHLRPSPAPVWPRNTISKIKDRKKVTKAASLLTIMKYTVDLIYII